MSLSDKDITAKNFQEFYNRIKPFLNQTAPSGFTPIGTVISVMGKKAPENYLACDGTAYNILEYPELAVYIKDQFGSYNYFGGDGTSTFAVPDLRGEFLRGTGTNSHANQGSGGEVGEHQDGTEHSDTYGAGGAFIIPTNSFNTNKDVNIPKTSAKYLSGSNLSADIADLYKYTSRPTNTSVLYCIAYKNIFIDVKQAYSLNERVVGTWIDGKPLYQKTWVIASPAEGIKLAENVDYCHVVSKEYSRQYSNGDTVDGDDFWYTANDYVNIRIVKNPNSSDMNLSICYKASNNAFTLKNLYITVQYTKTTD